MAPLTRDFRQTVVDRVRRDPAFKTALIREATEAFIEGDFDGCRSILRDLINATSGFDAVSRETNISAKSLMRMVGPRGNPTADNLSRIFAAVQKNAGVRSHVEVEELCHA